MTPERQRIAIAEWCGYTSINTYAPLWFSQDDGRFVPDYLSDLNAMHEAEKRLTLCDVMLWERYLRFLGFKHDMLLGEAWGLITAHAAQRAEAFLKTIGKWEDEISSPGSEQTTSGAAAPPKQGEV